MLNLRFTNHAFSIIEIIVAIVMIGIMLAVALPKYNRVVEKSRQAEAYTNLAAIRASQARYYAEKGEWADDWEELDAEEPSDPERYFDYSIETDPENPSYGEGTIAFAERNDNKNCCFGHYAIFISTSGKIGKEPDDDASQSPP